MTPQEIQEVLLKADCLYTKGEVYKALDKMAFEVSEMLKDQHPLVLSVMVGGLIPTGALLTRLDFPLHLDYVHASRYQNGVNGGALQWIVKPTTPLKDRTVLLVDDILDGGVTLAAIVEACREEGARAVHTAVLVNKQRTREAGGLLKADFVGLDVADRYVFGWGMDYKGYLRNMPGIYAVNLAN